MFNRFNLIFPVAILLLTLSNRCLAMENTAPSNKNIILILEALEESYPEEESLIKEIKNFKQRVKFSNEEVFSAKKLQDSEEILNRLGFEGEIPEQEIEKTLLETMANWGHNLDYYWKAYTPHWIFVLMELTYLSNSSDTVIPARMLQCVVLFMMTQPSLTSLMPSLGKWGIVYLWLENLAKSGAPLPPWLIEYFNSTC